MYVLSSKYDNECLINTQMYNSLGISIVIYYRMNWVQALPSPFSSMDSWHIWKSVIRLINFYLYPSRRCLDFSKLHEHAEKKCYPHSDQDITFTSSVTKKLDQTQFLDRIILFMQQTMSFVIISYHLYAGKLAFKRRF